MNQQDPTNLAISVKNISKTFLLPHEKQTSLKGAFLSSFRRKSFEKQRALRDISFDVKKGEFFGVVGRNGSGKSTLLKIIAGIYVPDSGSIQINGLLTPFIELGVGFSPELTGRENVFLNGALLGIDRKQMTEIYDEIVEFAELENFMDQKLKNYSSGMQVRLAFSIAIRAKGSILLLDEVLAVGDSSFQKKCFRYFDDLKSKKATVVLVTHDMSAVQRFCDRAVLIEGGKIIKSGKALDVINEYKSINLQRQSKENVSGAEYSEVVIVKIENQNEKEVLFTIQHNKANDKKHYFGFSLIKDGMTFAELNNLDDNNGHIRNHQLGYRLDFANLNSGEYEISATLFNKNDKEPIGFTKYRPAFVINGSDVNRGSAIRLAKTWESGK